MSSVKSYLQSLRAEGKKALAVLVDPDELHREDYRSALVASIQRDEIDLILVGGSLVTGDGFDDQLKWLRNNCPLPITLFPGSPTQLNEHVDAVLFLSLISGRNPDLLIGQHVIAAPRIKELNLEAISTGYMLIDGGKPTTASYISNTLPIPRDKARIAAATAMAGELLGMHCLYMDTGSGALFPVPIDSIKAVRKNTDIPLIVGGGIRSVSEADAAFRAGADLVVIGTLFEKEPELLASFSKELRSSQS